MATKDNKKSKPVDKKPPLTQQQKADILIGRLEIGTDEEKQVLVDRIKVIIEVLPLDEQNEILRKVFAVYVPAVCPEIQVLETPGMDQGKEFPSSVEVPEPQAPEPETVVDTNTDDSDVSDNSDVIDEITGETAQEQENLEEDMKKKPTTEVPATPSISLARMQAVINNRKQGVIPKASSVQEELRRRRFGSSVLEEIERRKGKKDV